MDYRETTWTNFRGRGRTFNGGYEKRQKTSANFLNEYLAMGIVWRDYRQGISISEYATDRNGANLRLNKDSRIFCNVLTAYGIFALLKI